MRRGGAGGGPAASTGIGNCVVGYLASDPSRDRLAGAVRASRDSELGFAEPEETDSRRVDGHIRAFEDKSENPTPTLLQ